MRRRSLDHGTTIPVLNLDKRGWIHLWASLVHEASSEGGREMRRNAGTTDRLIRAFVVAPATIVGAGLAGESTHGRTFRPPPGRDIRPELVCRL